MSPAAVFFEEEEKISNSFAAIADFLVSPVTMVLSLVLFLAAGAVLLFRREKLTSGQKIALILVLLLCLVYLVFLIWLSVMFGSNAHPPVPSSSS